MSLLVTGSQTAREPLAPFFATSGMAASQGLSLVAARLRCRMTGLRRTAP